MNPNAGEPVNPGGAAAPSNPLANLEGVVAAAKQEAAAAQTTTASVEAPPETPQGQFENQFGSGITPPVAETPSSSVAQLDPSINTVDDLLAKGPQVVEAVAPPEQTPADKLKQQIAADIDDFLKEVLQKQGVTP